MADVAIGKLTLKFSGKAPAHPERLAQLIAQALAQAPAGAVVGELGAIALNIAAAAGEDEAAIAARVAAQILSRLEN